MGKPTRLLQLATGRFTGPEVKNFTVHAVNACKKICFALASLPLSGDHHFNLTRTFCFLLLARPTDKLSLSSACKKFVACDHPSIPRRKRCKHTHRTLRYDRHVIDRVFRPVFYRTEKSLIARRWYVECSDIPQLAIYPFRSQLL